ncbi:uncharacterized protein [Panulirus ornatus]|uniref:uncharacterized protein n=1 Tax=Panulirus ornatus TaxID=150431 RepID=UPI003A86B46B
MCMKQVQKSRRCAAVASITLNPTLYTSTVQIPAVESAVSRGKPRMSRYKHRPFPSWLVYIWFLVVIAALFSTLVFFSDSISSSASSLSLMLQVFATALPSMPQYLLPAPPLVSPPPCVTTFPILKPGFLSPPPRVSTFPALKPGYLSPPPCVSTLPALKPGYLSPPPCVSTFPILKPGFLSPPPCVSPPPCMSTPAPRSHSSSTWIPSTPVIPSRSLLRQPSCAARFFFSFPTCPSCLPLPSSVLSRSASAPPASFPPSALSVPKPSSKSRVSSWKTKKSRTSTRTSSSSRTTSTSLSSSLTTSSPSRTTSTSRSSTSRTTSMSRSSSSTTSSPSRTTSTSSSTNSSSQTTSPSRSSPTTSSPLPLRTTATSRPSLTTPQSSQTPSLSPPTTTPTSQHPLTLTTTPIVTSTTESEAGSTRAAKPFVRIYTTRTLTIHQPTRTTQDYPYLLTIPSGLLSLMAQSRTANSASVSPSWSVNTGTSRLPDPREHLVQSTGAEALPPTLQNPTCVHDGAPVKTHCPLCSLWMCKNCSRMQSMDQWQYHLNTYYESLKLRTTNVTKSTTPFSMVLRGSILDDILPTEMDTMDGVIIGLLRLNVPFTTTSTRETLATTLILERTYIETPTQTVAATTITEAE